MKCNLNGALSFILVTVLTTMARAETVRTPTDGNPAMTIDVPFGWNSKIEKDGSLVVLSGSEFSGVRLRLFADPRMETLPLPQMAASLLKSTEAEPYSRVEAGSIDGHAGQAFWSAATNKHGFHFQVILTLAKLDASHLAAVWRLAGQGLQGGQVPLVQKREPPRYRSGEASTLNVIISEIRIVGLK